MPNTTYTTDVCIVGGGPAGMILALLLVHHGLKVLVLEGNPDFEREYRGEVLMPRFTQMARQIGLFSYLEKFPHLRLKNFEFFYKSWNIANVNFEQLSKDVPFAIWMPQPILLNALYEKAKGYANFQMLFGVTARHVVEENGQVVGLFAEHKGEDIHIRSRLVVGADGRNSIVRKTGGFEYEHEEHKFDLLWFTVKKPAQYDNTIRAFLSRYHNYLVLPKYPDAIQCGLVIGPGEYANLRKKGIEALRKEILQAHWVMRDFANELKDFTPFNVLQARVTYVKKWAKDGCLLIGDAAHTCSPAGAIGVSAATGTAIVAADIILKGFKNNDLSGKNLNQVQALREEDVKEIQARQKVASRLITLDAPRFKWLIAIVIFLVSRFGLFRVLRKIAVMEKPLPIDPKLSLEK